jgi:hypothetical protein
VGLKRLISRIWTVIVQTDVALAFHPGAKGGVVGGIGETLGLHLFQGLRRNPIRFQRITRSSGARWIEERSARPLRVTQS